ncbi:PTS IIA-like nitrogen regulatory protein PtsN [Caldichromatium japonicum]|uniref:PTS IIA-like nitrogen regulatory protein PtsN n=1 Tax=Caldichromatium japonicum TaxID=2699430 RepID=A0A6G7VGR2_9GAMM|nr:PTS IIA-like nitrogen regulatory protein PtsN [Caldichromatium japonicum]
MMPELIAPERIRCALEVASKKRLIETLAELLASAHPRLQTETVFEHLIERERLGSTGLGYGVALPHARIAQISDAVGAFVRTNRGIDYDATDGQPVDLAFALLVPDTANDEHLRLLAHLATLFSDPDIRAQLRKATSSDEVLRVLNTL